MATSFWKSHARGVTRFYYRTNILIVKNEGALFQSIFFRSCLKTTIGVTLSDCKERRVSIRAENSLEP